MLFRSDQTHEAIFIWELDGGIAYWNRGAEETYGFTRTEALGRKSYELLNTSPRSNNFLDILRRQGQWTGELTNVRRDGVRVVVESHMVMEGGDGQSRLVFETNNPVTERKMVEENLRRQANELVAADRSKDEFLALLAHELRNPLAPLTNALQILKQPTAAPPLLDRARDVMSRQVQNMARMVDDLLDVSRITQGRIEIRKEPVNLTTIIERAVESARADFQAREQELVISMPDQPVILDADALRLEQVLGNLLNNASKFSSRHQRIWLTVDEPADGRAAIRVRDQGIGIAPEHLPRVFEQFMQVDSSLSRVTGGLGIGLSIVRHLVALHGGTVEAISTGLGQGSEFVIRLPVSVTPGEQAPRTSETLGFSHPSRARRILVADDNADGADTLGMLLRQAGHDVRVVYGGAEALETALTMRPEVVLVDVGMPGMDGYETARRLRQSLGPTVRLVAITGYAANRQHALAAGFNDFLVKPASPGVIARLVSQPLPGEETPTANAADN